LRLSVIIKDATEFRCLFPILKGHKPLSQTESISMQGVHISNNSMLMTDNFSLLTPKVSTEEKL